MVEAVEAIELAEAARERYLRYALSVITSRALPDVRDGLKPVQRRILYAMENDLGLRPDGRHVKSAKVVGQVMSNYHPHGDSAIYEAMVRMAQPFALRYPLVDGQGNFGAITGDDAAAFRYTEAKLAPLGHELMATLGERTVDARPTYDDATTEPEVLPVPVPLLLLNGSTGIAVGMATNVPPHNLKDVVRATTALIDDPEASPAALARAIKGPDFPTGGEVLATKAELRQLYETGRGTFKLRGAWALEETQAKGQRVPRRALVVRSVPYGTTTGQVLAKVRDLLDQKKLPQVAHASDQTNKKDGVRLVLELKGDADPAPLAAALYRLTPLEVTFGVNLTLLLPTGTGVGRPAQVDLKALLRQWLDFRFATVTRSLQFRRDRLLERLHVLEGLLKVLAAIDVAVKLVRSARDRDDARQKLMKKFALSEVQADAVLEIRLYRLAALEVEKLADERAEKQAEADRLAKLLATDRPRWALIKQELEDYAARYGDARRTKLRADDDDEVAFDPTALIKREDTHVVVSRDGRLKRVRQLGDPTKLRLRDDDALLAVLQASTVAPVALVSNQGSCYVMTTNDVPATAGFGEPVQKFFSFADGERLVGALSLDPRLVPPPGHDAAVLLVATAQGNVLRVPLDPHREPSTRAGRKLVRLVDGDEVVACELPPRGAKDVLLATSDGRALRCPLDEVPLLAGAGKGRRGVELGRGQALVGATAGPRLLLETTRGATEVVTASGRSRAAFGGPGEVLKQRGGYARALPPPPDLEPLPPDAQEG